MTPDMDVFAEKARTTNVGAPLKINQSRKGYHLGIGYHLAAWDEEFSPYFRLSANFNHQSGKEFSEGPSVKQRSNNVDGLLGIGFGGSKSGAVLFTLYGLAGGTYVSSSMEFGSEFMFTNGKYKFSRLNFVYGFGFGIFGNGGGGLAMDLLFSFPGMKDDGYYQLDDTKIPEDYDTWVYNPSGYTGAYVHDDLRFIRFQLTAFIPLSKGN